MPDLSYRVLGPLEVLAGGHMLPLGGRMPRILLGTLLLQPGRVVSTDVLVDVLWPAEPPASAVANLRTYVRGLRSRLSGDAIMTKPHGYAVRVDPDALDLTLFEDRAARARQAWQGGDAAGALRLLEEAIGLWRGRLLEDLPGSSAWEAVASRLTAQKTSLVELAMEIRIGLGQPDVAAAELRGLLAADPLHEGFWRRLMLALHASGRTAEALRAYADARQVLADELGVEPGPQLRAAFDTVLGATPPAAGPICQLPLNPPDFTGRSALVDSVVAHLTGGPQPALVAISGAPGVGKSALAVHAGHAVRGSFPDGQLYVDMRGTTEAPRDPREVLAELLRALGVSNVVIPDGVEARAALLRSRLADARMLLVLDDVAHAGQVRPLLPGAGACAVVATSRQRLPELTGALQVNVDVLTEQEAQELFGRVAGRRRVVEQPESAREILRACGHLPLAVRIAGAKLAQRPGWSLSVLADRLRLERHRLDELRAGDLAVRASVELSYRLLPPAAARAFRLLGTLGPGPVPAWVVSALIGSDSEDTVDVLVDANLLQLVGMDVAGQARYRLHDLLRCYGVERADEEGSLERRAATVRVLDGWLALAAQARDRMPVHFFGASFAPPQAAFDGAERLVADPMAWFEAERAALVSAVELASLSGLDGHAWRIAAALAPFFDLRSHRDVWWRTHQIGLSCARRVGDAHGEAILLRDIGQLHLYHDRYDEAAAAFDASRELFVRAGDEAGEALALCGQGTVHRVKGRHHRALRLYRRGLDAFTRGGDRANQAVVSGSIGLVHLALRRRDEAQRWLTTAYEMAVEIGDRHREANALHHLAMLRQEWGRPDRAQVELDRALALLEELGDDACAAYVRQSIGELHLRFGDPRRAGAFLTDSLSVLQRMGDRRAEATIAALLGEWHDAAGRTRPAQEYLTRALDTWRELEAPGPAAAVAARLRALG
ncbi:AfsR/SARP family transcriptional regulator [Phytohabitans rumicis]|uniref:SARP family transcriptional regulator n=1 Tax=Phytohabitans rumicis TaxID=1076125 RepID=A0A6V8L686_9ACTN|nr:BTAD domain-containing putative transcriptional regulator [Phytohabitans rumicis]GFJ92752.1 SARP family transcriptional regulator [Phytohabitans rumicis]